MIIYICIYIYWLGRTVFDNVQYYCCIFPIARKYLIDHRYISNIYSIESVSDSKISIVLRCYKFLGILQIDSHNIHSMYYCYRILATRTVFSK